MWWQTYIKHLIILYLTPQSGLTGPIDVSINWLFNVFLKVILQLHTARNVFIGNTIPFSLLYFLKDAISSTDTTAFIMLLLLNPRISCACNIPQLQPSICTALDGFKAQVLQIPDSCLQPALNTERIQGILLKGDDA